jgi:Zn finger protein HypA/HybF involved in hydrogenase expression
MNHGHKHKQEGVISSQGNTIVEQNPFIKFCSTCNNRGFVLGPDEENKTEKTFIEECPDCNSS